MVESRSKHRHLLSRTAAFAELVAKHRGPVYGFLRARLVRPADAEGLTEEVFRRLYSTRAEFDNDDALRPGLLDAARAVLRDHVHRFAHRNDSGWTDLCLDLDEAEPCEDDRETRAQLPMCLDGLGPSAREAIELKYRANRSLAEIGQRLRRSESAVRLLVFRARQSVRYCLERRQVLEPTE